MLTSLWVQMIYPKVDLDNFSKISLDFSGNKL